jgi:NADH-quinone oxidoreductase subunit M
MAHGEAPQEHRHHPDLSLREVMVLAPVLALILAFGVYPNVLIDRIDPAAQRIVAHVDASAPTLGFPSAAAAQGEGTP